MQIIDTVYQELKDDLYLFNIGQNFESYKLLGNKSYVEKGVSGIRFTVWAPRAQAVFVIGDFNGWQEQPLYAIKDTGVWYGFSSDAKEGDCYKYVIVDQHGHKETKIDPFAQKFEMPPSDASIIYEVSEKNWKDGLYVYQRGRRHILNKPLNIYEVHASSWKRHYDGSYYTFKDLEEHLLPYVKEMGYTHIEFMPLMEHPLEESWGYQITGYYAIFSKYGTIEQFQNFVESAHRLGIGIILDWVPGHFCRNQQAIAFYDGTPTFEYEDYSKAENRGWGTLNFDLGKNQVRSFLISNALFWLEQCHVDGLRVDAVSNILYLDFDNPNWQPNKYGDNRNLEGIEFLQLLNSTIYDRNPDAIMIAEESTAWDGVTRPVHYGGLGFLFKWNMGWMNDTLKFIEKDPIYRKYDYRLLTFTFMYQYNEQYILPFSHDEVVHGKHSMLGKMPGDRYNQFANLRTLQAYMFALPGKKLNFMGNELGQFLEWRFYSELEWVDLSREFNREFQHFMKSLHLFYKGNPAFYELDHDSAGIDILEADNLDETIVSFIRKGKKKKDQIIMIANFVPVERQNYRVGVPLKGEYDVVFNTERKEFGGSWESEQARMTAQMIPHQNQPYSIECTLPSLGVIFLKRIK